MKTTITPSRKNDFELVLNIHYKQKCEYKKANDMTEFELESAYYEGLMDAFYILTDGEINRENGKHTCLPNSIYNE